MSVHQTFVLTLIIHYACRNLSTLLGLASPDPLSNMYEASYFRATWILTALDAGFWTAMKVRWRPLREVTSVIFSIFYLFAAELADEKVRKVRGRITVEHMRVSWNKGAASPILRTFQAIIRRLRGRAMSYRPVPILISRPPESKYSDKIKAWLYFDGPKEELLHQKNVILDIPGGGFVAMTPRCNDDRLEMWAKDLKIPILSLEYKKAPEYPYPYALNECYDAYSTLIQTKGRCIGLSGDSVPNVILTGDSAGGNLATATTLMIIESGSGPLGRLKESHDLPIPDGLILFYPALDMNISSWMSEEQLALIKDRRLRKENKLIIETKATQYPTIANTPEKVSSPVQSDTEADTTTPAPIRSDSTPTNEQATKPAPKYATTAPTKFRGITQGPPRSTDETISEATARLRALKQAQASNHYGTTPQQRPLRTQLAMSSIISYFNDRILTPEMMRAMVILYVGPHNKPDFQKDYLLSPILAPDALLAKFPKTYFITGERDPLVDDTAIFAGRLRRVKAAQMASKGQRFEYRDSDANTPGYDPRAVSEIWIVPGVSHGFGQFPALYENAYKFLEQAEGYMRKLFAEAEKRKARESGEKQWLERMRRRSKEESDDDEPHMLVLNVKKNSNIRLQDIEAAKRAAAVATAAATAASGDSTKKTPTRATRRRTSSMPGTYAYQSTSSSEADESDATARPRSASVLVKVNGKKADGQEKDKKDEQDGEKRKQKGGENGEQKVVTADGTGSDGYESDKEDNHLDVDEVLARQHKVGSEVDLLVRRMTTVVAPLTETEEEGEGEKSG